MGTYLENLIDRQISGKLASTRPCYSRFTTESSRGGTLSCNPDGLVNPPFACRFSTIAQNGHLLALADEEGFVTIIDTSKPLPQSLFVGEAWGAHPPPKAQWLAHTNAIFDVCWVLDDTCILTASGDQAIGLWNCERAMAYARFQGHSASVKTLDQHPGNPNVFASGSRDGNVLVWDQRTNAQGWDSNNINIHSPVLCIKGAAHAAASLPTRHTTTVTRRTTPRGGGRRGHRGALEPTASVTSVKFLQSGWALLSGGAGDDVVRFWDIRKAGTQVTNTRALSTNVDELQGAPMLAATTRGEWGDPLRQYGVTSITEGHLGPLATFGTPTLGSFYIKSAMCPEGAHVLTGGADSVARIWQVDTTTSTSPRNVYELRGHESEVTCVAWCPTESCKVATCGDDCSIRIWHVEPPPPPPPSPRRGRRQQPLVEVLPTPAPVRTAAVTQRHSDTATPPADMALHTPASQVLRSTRRHTASQATIQRSLLDFVIATPRVGCATCAEACSTTLGVEEQQQRATSGDKGGVPQEDENVDPQCMV